ncbi:hypothetical protein [Phocaeicola faecicola]|uniref:hypothetical protein n=1 Tax=Phocaeicola faecicola TaxID=2739389 RepID=UPI0015E6DD2A|nr:hypothetical protein [Phocaeicola faecicola]
MKLTYIISALCACVYGVAVPAQGMAQEANAEQGDSVKRFFNALDYTLQKRYVPKGREISAENPGKNVFVSAVAGGLQLRGAQDMLFLGGFSIGKEVSPFNAYRATFLGGKNKMLKMAGAEVDHMFNLSDYLGGYREGAHMNLLTVVGLGVYTSQRSGGEKNVSASLHGGLQLRYHMGSHWDWFVEPKMYVFTDEIDGLQCNKRYNLAYGVTGGLTYRFKGLPIQDKSEDAGDNLFLEAAMGVQGDYSSHVRNLLGKIRPLGPTASLSLGKWFMPLGVRATAFGGFHFTDNPERKKGKEVYAGGRVEALLNLNTLLKPSVTDPRMEVNLAAGYELGAVAHRSPQYAKQLRWTNGPTGAVQLVYFVTEQIGLFGEGRYSMSDYTQPYENGQVYDRRMNNLSAVFGVQYRRRKARFDERRGVFEPHNFVYGSLGGNFPVRTSGLSMKNLRNVLGQQASLGIGRQYSAFSGVRAGIEVARWADSKRPAYPLTLSADYLLNVTNLIGNYNPERIFDLNAFVGVAYTHHDLEKKHYGALEGGLLQEFRVSDSWSIYAEEYARMYKGKIAPSVRVYTSNEVSLLLGGNLGLKYRF